MRDTIFIVIFGLFIYFGFATVVGDNALMGSYGAAFASYNHFYFGYFSYIYIFLLLIPLYKLHKDSSINNRKIELALAMFLSIFSILMAQSMLVSGEFRGEIGASFVDTLSPFIGSFGLWIFWLMITFVSIIISLDKTAAQIMEILLKKIDDMSQKNRVANEQKRKDKEIKKAEEEMKTVQKPQHVVVEQAPLQMQTQEIVEVKHELPVEKITIAKPETKTEKDEQHVEVVQTPLEQKHNILELVQEIKEQKIAIVVNELEENAKLLEGIEKGEVEKPKNFKLPSVDFLQKPTAKAYSVDESELDAKIKFLIEKLAHFKIEGDVVRTYAGPVVSTFEFKPAANVKVSRILNLQDDIAMALSAQTIRIQAPIPGKDVVGIEIPNEKIDTIYLRDLLDSTLFKESSSPLTIVLGKDIVGKPFITDLKKLPHLLIAGTTGSGKSVGINAMILSLLYKNSPDQLRLLMVDPKMLEFSIYNDIPHLLTPVITKPKQAIVALNNMVYEMERRYALMSENRTKNIENYNEKV